MGADEATMIVNEMGADEITKTVSEDNATPVIVNEENATPLNIWIDVQAKTDEDACN